MVRASFGSGSTPRVAAVLFGSLLCACQSTRAPAPSPAPVQQRSATDLPVAPKLELQEPSEPLTDPVPLWEHGQAARMIDAATSRERGYLVLDLGENWAPYLFSEGADRSGKLQENGYRPTYLALARGEFPDDAHGERAKNDKYLELFGILPTLGVLRVRMNETAKRDCTESLDLAPLQSFFNLVTYSDPAAAKRAAAQFATVEAATLSLMEEQAVSTLEALDVTKVPTAALATVKRYGELLPQWRALDALQKRLQCEGFLTGKGKFLPGVMDWATHSALAEYERRNHVFSLGYLGKDSLTPLRRMPLDVDRDSVLRVLTERAIHTAGILEDGSVDATPPVTFTGRDGEEHTVPNLTAQLREALIEAFGLQSPETTLGWMNSLGPLPAAEHRYVAIKMVPLPEYYASQMELTLDYDRGDVWYDFPYDDKGKEISQPVSRRPQVTVSTIYQGQKIPLARYGTTIGGWRTELVEGTVMWKYKDSPVGPRAWDEIVAAPVWLPPDTTPPEDLLAKNPARKSSSDPEYVVKYHETGPSYASAYGLVAAYHRTFARKSSGRIALGNDEGIRTHGSVDYMSIMRRHSHGCHRLHNHIALRLMSFVLAHRPHERQGQEPLYYRRLLSYKDQTYKMQIDRGGYVFKLETPLVVNVEEGRIRGSVKHPIEIAIPKYNPELRAYVTPQGGAVRVRGDQLLAIPMPPPAAKPTRNASGTLLARTANEARTSPASVTGRTTRPPTVTTRKVVAR